MRFSPRLVSALCVLSIAVPVGAGAATAAKTIRLRDIVKIVEANEKPLSFTMLMLAGQGGNTGAIGLKGSHNGRMDSLDDAVAEATLTVDVELEDDSKIYAKVAMRVLGGKAYLRLDEFLASGTAALYADIVKPYEKRWVELPLNPSEYAAPNRSNRASLSKFEPFFTITQSTTGDLTRYSIAIPKAKQRRFLTVLMGAASRYSTRYNAELRRAIRMTRLDVDISVDAIDATFDAAKGSVSVMTTVDRETSTFHFTGNTKTLTAPPAVVAPPDAVTLDELFETAATER